jgi:hypothetical protein
MPLYYTPFDAIDPDIAHLGMAAYASSGNCLAGQSSFSVVGHGDRYSTTIDNGLGREMTAEQVVEQMKRQGLGRATQQIFLHACDGGGSTFEGQLRAALDRHSELRRISLSGYAGILGRMKGVAGAVMLPAGHRAGKRNRDHRVIPSSSGSGRR